jgi:hypothetical protein
MRTWDHFVDPFHRFDQGASLVVVHHGRTLVLPDFIVRVDAHDKYVPQSSSLHLLQRCSGSLSWMVVIATGKVGYLSQRVRVPIVHQIEAPVQVYSDRTLTCRYTFPLLMTIVRDKRAHVAAASAGASSRKVVMAHGQMTGGM